MIRMDIKRLPIFEEFSADKQQEYFSVVRDKVIHNIDTLYYCVSLQEDYIPPVKMPDKPLTEPVLAKLPVTALIDDLKALRDMPDDPDRDKEFYGFVYRPCSFAFYRHCLSVQDEYDIFIAENLPNGNTPRIVVQLRSIGLWTYGDKEAVSRSFEHLHRLLRAYRIPYDQVRENRIDFAFHTNAIQNMAKYFSDDCLMSNMCSTLTKYQKVGSISDEITIEYLSLGKRQSNNIFVRFYDKTREVIDMHYKAAFIQIWRDNELISEYDKYVLEKAYEWKSWRSGVAIGKIDWYMEYGANDDVKAELQDLRKKYLVDNANCVELDKRLSQILPNITKICNIEFQTKRRYYWLQRNAIGELPCSVSVDSPYFEIYRILDNRALFLDQLTKHTVRFVKDRSIKVNDLKGTDFLSWWRRIRACKTPCMSNSDLYRSYQKNADLRRNVKGIVDKVAALSTIKHNGNVSGDFSADLADALSYINDNDVTQIIGVDENGEVNTDFKYDGYDIILNRKLRQYSFLFSNDDTI